MRGTANRLKNSEIIVVNVKKQWQKIPNWKTTGKNNVQGYWIKNFHSLYMRIVYQMNKVLELDENIPTWMTYGRTVLCQKDPAKGIVVENYRPITCLSLM